MTLRKDIPLTAQEAPIRKARCQQGLAPSEGCRENPSCLSYLLLAPGIPRAETAAASMQSLPSLSRGLLLPFLSSLCLLQGLCTGRPHPELFNLSVSAKTLVPNKVTSPGSGTWLCRVGGHHATHRSTQGVPHQIATGLPRRLPAPVAPHPFLPISSLPGRPMIVCVASSVPCTGERFWCKHPPMFILMASREERHEIASERPTASRPSRGKKLHLYEKLHRESCTNPPVGTPAHGGVEGGRGGTGRAGAGTEAGKSPQGQVPGAAAQHGLK